jgi:hypothetical protein
MGVELMAIVYQGTPHHKAKNVKLTSIARLRHFKHSDPDENYSYNWHAPRIKMVGYPEDEINIYAQMMREKADDSA